MQLLAPITGTARGLKGYWRGVSWLRKHPRYFLLLFTPMLIGLVSMVYGWRWFLHNDDWIFGRILFTPSPDDFLMVMLHHIATAFLYLGFTLVSLVVFVSVTNVLASPIYEIVSQAVERDVTGKVVEQPFSLRSILVLMREELKKVFFIALISLALFWVPGLNLLAALLTAFLIGWGFYDYPLARRGWLFRDRWRFAIADFWVVLGLGLWMLIPFSQFFFMPMAVVGATMLNLERLQQQSGEPLRRT